MLNNYSRTSIIQISWLYGLFLWSQLGQNTHKSRSRSVAISFLKLQHWKVQSNARFLCFQTAKAALACMVTNDEHSNEFWMAQGCIVAKWNFTLYYILLVRSVWYAKQTSDPFFSIKDKQPIIIIVRLEKGKKEPICQLNMALVSSRSLISTRTRKRSWSLPTS